MTTVGIQELREHLDRYLDAVRNGDEVVVTEEGEPVARIVPEPVPDVDDAAEAQCLARLAAEGILRPALRGPRPEGPPPLEIPGRPLSDIIIEDRG